MKLTLERKVPFAFALTLVPLVLISLISYNSIMGLLKSAADVSHTHNVKTQLETILAHLADIETGQRGYVITGEESYLDPYHTGLSAIEPDLESIRKLTADNPNQQSRLQRLGTIIAQRIAFAASVVAARKDAGTEAATQLIKTGQGKILLDNIRAIVAAMQDEETQLLQIREQDTRSRTRRTLYTIMIGDLLALGIIALAIMIIGGEIAARRTAQAELERSHGELEQRVANRTSELIQAKEHWQVTVASIGDAVIVTDADGKITYLNSVAEKLTEWTNAAARGQPLAIVFHIVDAETHLAEQSPFERVMQERQIVNLPNNTLLVSRSGRDIPIDDSAAPIRNEASEVEGVVLVFRDITERRKVEAELQDLLAKEQAARDEAEAAGRAKDEFLATISHDLRTPLNAIVGWVTMLRKGQLSEQSGERALETIERNARAQQKLIDDLLDLSRVISGRLRLEMQPVNIAEIIDNAIDAVAHTVKAKDIRLRKLLIDDAGPVWGDPHRLQQVLWNLLGNAVKFTPKNGQVEVQLSRVDSNVEITVSDTGRGIKTSFLPVMFERFRQDSAAVDGHTVGLGLGLSIVRHLVELHGGQVSAESEGEGHGATFRVTLPLMAVRTSSSLESEKYIPSVPTTVPDEAQILQGLKILAVDDEADVRELMVALLGRHGAEIRVAASATEALIEIQKWQADLLIADIGMPDMDGYDLIRELRRQESERRGRKIPALALTAYAKREDRLRALTAGFQTHVSKPVEPNELITVIASLTGRLSI